MLRGGLGTYGVATDSPAVSVAHVRKIATKVDFPEPEAVLPINFDLVRLAVHCLSKVFFIADVAGNNQLVGCLFWTRAQSFSRHQHIGP
jgi:hypothetical protein